MSTVEIKKPAPTEKPAREATPVRTMWFLRPTDLPGKNSADGLMCKDTAGARWTAEHQPWRRLFVVSYWAPGSKEPERRNVMEHVVASWIEAV